MSCQVTLDTVLRHPEQFVSCAFRACESTAKATLNMAPKASSLPKLTFSWQPSHEFYCLTEEEAQRLEAAGFVVERREDAQLRQTHLGGVSRSCFVREVDLSYITLCNFRRYGWSWTTSENGEYGYRDGPIYANGLHMHFLAETSGQVVRDTLVECWTLMVANIGGGFATCFGSDHAVSALLRALLEDAQVNISRHAYGWRERTTYLTGGPDIKVIAPSGEVSESTVERSAPSRLDWERANPEALMALVPQV